MGLGGGRLVDQPEGMGCAVSSGVTPRGEGLPVWREAGAGGLINTDKSELLDAQNALLPVSQSHPAGERQTHEVCGQPRPGSAAPPCSPPFPEAGDGFQASWR